MSILEAWKASEMLVSGYIYKIQLPFFVQQQKITSTVARCFCKQTDPLSQTEGKLSSPRIKGKTNFHLKLV